MVALVLSLAVIVIAAGTAHAGSAQATIFQDDGMLQRFGSGMQASALDDIKGLGATTIHVLVAWDQIAPAPDSTDRPPGFIASDPTAYPPGVFDTLDALVLAARARGLGVLLTPTAAVPAWASNCSQHQITMQARNTCAPDPDQYQQFVEALGRHFSGDLVIHQWSLWNEPNLESWLRPQWSRVDGRLIDYGAVLYRRLARAGIAGLHATGHGNDRILLGETSPSGGIRGGNSAAPTRFISRLLCLDDAGHPVKGGDARRYDCRHNSRLAVTGFAHHPYTPDGVFPPTAVVSKRGEITLGYVARLESLLSSAAHYGRVPKRTRIWNTEFGFQTNPPNPWGMSPARQALCMNESEYISWLDPWVASFAQYGLVDEPDPIGPAGAGPSTALMFNVSFGVVTRKPAYDAFATPIYVTKAGRRAVYVWGGARPAGAGERVAIQAGSGDSYTTVARATTGSRGYLRARLPKHRGLWRLAWTDDEGVNHFSRAARENSEPVRRQ